MPQHTWTFDAPTGTYKSHAMSQKLYMAALADAVFMEDVIPFEGFGRKMGETLTLKRVANLTEPTDASLDETDRIPEDSLSLSTTSVTVSEIGRAVPYTSLAEDLGSVDLTNAVQKALRDQLKLTLDAKAATAYKAGKIKYAITGASSSNIATNGTFGATSTANWNYYHVEEIRDYMFDTLHVPPMAGGDYMAIVRTLGLRGLKRDADWEEWHKYTDPNAKRNSEVGRIENIRFQECNHSTALGKVGTSSVLGEGVVFGDDAVGIAEVTTPELRASMPGDFGRKKAIAWYGVLEFLQIWGDSANAGEARVLHVGSA